MSAKQKLNRKPEEGAGDSELFATSAPVSQAALPAEETDSAQQDGPRIAAFFDVDETIIRGASTYHLAREFHRRHYFRRTDIFYAVHQALLYALMGEDPKRIARIKRRALDAIGGLSVAELHSIGEDVYAAVLGHRIFPGTLELLNEHLQQGHEVWLVSASPTEVGQLIARRIGATGALGTEVATKEGRYLPELVGKLMHGQGKADAIVSLARERGIDLDRSFAYGDSLNDLPMLSVVGIPSAINPDPRLRLWAVANDWDIHDFRRRRHDVGRAAKRSAWVVAGALTLLRLRSFVLNRLRP